MIGIDKIGLWSNDFRVKDLRSPEFGVMPVGQAQGGKKTASVILTDRNGHTAEVNKVYHNSPSGLFNLDINHKGLSITFNPSKQAHAFNLISTESPELPDILNAIQKKVSSLIDVNMNSMKLSRCDIARNVTLNSNYNAYSSAFRLLNLKRQNKKIEYPNGVTNGNKSIELGIYDKTTKAKLDDPLVLVPDNLLRGEVRALKTQSVKRHFHADTLNALLEIPADDIGNMYRDYLLKIAFHSSYKSNQLTINQATQRDIFTQMRQTYSKKYFDQWLLVNGTDSILSLFDNDLGNINDFLIECGESKQTRGKQIKRLKGYIQQRGAFKIETSLISPSELISEVKQKLVA